MIDILNQTIEEFFRITDGIAMSDVIGWGFTIIVGMIAYRLIDDMQTALERHGMLKDIEDSFTELYNSPIARSCDSADENNLKQVFVRSVLHDDKDWETIENEEKGLEFQIVEQQRYIHIRDGYGEGKFVKKYFNEWISTQALHEITLRCRRIEKMFKDRIIKRIDLADMFRELVPLGMSGRLQFFLRYYGKYDAECIAYLVMQTIVSCKKYKNDDIVKKFVQYYNCHKEIHTLFTENRRVRPILDRRMLTKFQKICNEK